MDVWRYAGPELETLRATCAARVAAAAQRATFPDDVELALKHLQRDTIRICLEDLRRLSRAFDDERPLR